ncbi:MAG TPA: hypothetical protein VGR15_05455, partial [Bacteroidota bacterium]|nr:hypothetical protein [Bacteroidota bacterium]
MIIGIIILAAGGKNARWWTPQFLDVGVNAASKCTTAIAIDAVAISQTRVRLAGVKISGESFNSRISLCTTLTFQ